MSKRTIGMGGFTLAGATHVDMSACTRKPLAGFTLAEVLITLGIIGVVAAMTMPTLINSTNGAQYKTAYKKALSVMSQAVAMHIALEDYDLSETVAGTNPVVGQAPDADGNGGVAAAGAAGVQSIYSIFRNRLNVVKVATGGDFNTTPGDAKYYPIITDNDSNDYTTYATNKSLASTQNNFVSISGTDVKSWGTNSTFLFMNDGITLIFDNTQEACRQAIANLEDNYCFAFIDVNGQKGPNKVVECDDKGISGTEGTDDYACTVSNPTDIYPIAMYNQTIIPASAAARAVLFAK